MWSNRTKLASALQHADTVLHFAGVNRAETDSELLKNVTLARELTAALDTTGSRAMVVFANSIQSGNQTTFGRAKQEAADSLRAWGQRSGAKVADVRLPNLFGEHGRPHYNSVVATFSFQLANGASPRIIQDRVLPFLHVQDAVEQILALIEAQADGEFPAEGTPMSVSDLLERLRGFSELYRRGDIPDVTNRFDRALFNTYRSFCFPELYPLYTDVKSDSRGRLFECVRAHGGQCQVFCSSTHPGITRGNHFHLRKIERFIVLQGDATISLRRLFDHSVVRFRVAGSRPAMVDMPTMWTHSIANTGRDELITLFWADEIPEQGSTDTYGEPVELVETSA